jgi:hypothetical protein
VRHPITPEPNKSLTQDAVAALPPRSGETSMLRRKLPYLILLVLAM